MFYINPKHWRYIDPILFIALLATGFYLLDKGDDVSRLIASILFCLSLAVLYFMIDSIRKRNKK